MIAPDADLLPQVAALMRREADTHCCEMCHGYHGIWSFMRLFGCLPAVARDHHALMEKIGLAARQGARKVLVSGSADTGVLAYVIAGFARAGVTPEVTVVDACETPLAACRWYGAQRGVQVTTEAIDIMAYGGRGFDLIVAHNFLNFFDPPERVRLAKLWFDALRPGGQVLSFSSIKPEQKPRSRRFPEARLAILIDEMLAAHARSPEAHRIAADDLAAMVRDYGVRRYSNNLTQASQIIDPLRKAGFACGALLEHKPSADIAEAIRSKRPERYCLEARRPMNFADANVFSGALLEAEDMGRSL